MKRILIGLLVVAILILNAGIKPTVAQEQIVLKQWYHQYGEEGTQEAVQRYADEYNKLNPNIKIEITWVPGDYASKLNAALQTAEAPDVFELSGITIDRIRAGQLAELDDLYTDELVKDFGAAMEFVTFDDHKYGIKMINDTGGIYYRKSVLEEAGVKPPTTMAELIDAAAKLTTKSRSGLFIGNDGGKGDLFTRFMIWSAGGELLKDGKAAFNTERTAEALLKLKELNKSGSLLVGAPADWWDPSALTDDLAAMQFTGLWAMPGITKALGDDFGIVPWPAFDADGTPTTWIGGWSEVVNAKSAHLEEAKAFAKWMWIENIKIQQDWSLAYGFHIPPRNSAAASADPLKTGPASEVVEFTSKYGKVENPGLWNTTMTTALVDAVNDIFTNDADPMEALNAAAEKVNAELKVMAAK